MCRANWAAIRRLVAAASVAACLSLLVERVSLHASQAELVLERGLEQVEPVRAEFRRELYTAPDIGSPLNPGYFLALFALVVGAIPVGVFGFVLAAFRARQRRPHWQPLFDAGHWFQLTSLTLTTVIVAFIGAGAWFLFVIEPSAQFVLLAFAVNVLALPRWRALSMTR
jgi:hypothetical protein